MSMILTNDNSVLPNWDNSKPCEGCDGSGVRAPAIPSCELSAEYDDLIIIEKCDTCDLHADDMAAALSRFDGCEWVQCTDGGWHVVARAIKKGKRVDTLLTLMCVTGYSASD